MQEKLEKYHSQLKSHAKVILIKLRFLAIFSNIIETALRYTLHLAFL